MNRFNYRFWFACGFAAIVCLLLVGTIASAQSVNPSRNERILSGFFGCSGPSGERMCPFTIHYVEFVKGRSYGIRMESTEFNPSLMLEDMRGNMLARDTDDFDALPGLIVFRAPATGTYRLIGSALSPMREGFYLIYIRELPVVFNVAEELTSSDPMHNDCHARSYDVALTAGRRYVIDLASSEFDPYLRLTTTEGVIVAFADESLGSRGARIVFVPTRTASYRIVATTFAPGCTGAFGLSVCEE